MSLVLWAIAVLLSGAVLSVLLMPWPRKALLLGLSATGIAGAMGVAGAWPVLRGDDGGTIVLRIPLPLGAAHFALDGLSAWFVLAIGVLTVAVAIYSWGYLRGEVERGADRTSPSANVPVYAALLCVLVSALLATVTAGDIVLFLLAWEGMSISAFFLVGIHDRDPEARHGAWMYLIATHIGTAVFLLPLFGILVSRATGPAGAILTDFAAFAPAMRSAPTALAVTLFVLGLIGFGTKAGFMPMHVWLPRAHPVAPSPISALMSGVVIKTGIYGLLRLLSWLGPLPEACAIVMIVLASVTGVAGVLYALAQPQLKRLLAYSSIENMGIIGMGIGIGMLGQATGHVVLEALGFAGALLHVLNHAMMKGLLFLSAGAVVHGTGTGEMERLGGLAQRMPINSALFLIAALAISALPPFNGLVSEWLIYSGLFDGARSGQAWSWVPVLGLTALALIGGLVLACFAKVFTVVFLGTGRDVSIRPHPTPPAMLAGMAILAVACLVMGLGAGALPPLLTQASVSLLAAQWPVAGDTLTASLNNSLDSLAGVTRVFAILLSVAAGLGILRWMLPGRRRNAEGVSTWGCGYAYASARVQYTASSFAWSLVHSFRQVLRPQRIVTRPNGYFPIPGHLATQTPDGAETHLYRPLFAGIARLSQRLWPLQNGRIQLYLLYIVGTLLVLFTVEFFWSPFGQERIGGLHPAPILTTPALAQDAPFSSQNRSLADRPSPSAAGRASPPALQGGPR